jgi:hypothetical protein
LSRWFAEHGIRRQIVVWGAGRDGRRFARAWEAERSAGNAGDRDLRASGSDRAELNQDSPGPGSADGLGSQAGTPAPEIVAFVDIDPRKIGRRRHGRPILDPESAHTSFPDAFYLAAVGVPGARGLIRSKLTSWGMSEGEDFLCLH